MTRDSHDAVRTVSAAAGTTLGALFGALGRVRPASRPLHPRGQVLRGVLHREGATPAIGVPWLDGTGEDPVLVRSSRSVGLPAPLPDVFGLAVRIDPDGDRPADLLLATTGRGRLTRFLFAPARSTAAPMSTVMPFRTPVGPVLLGARRTGTRTVELTCATLTGPWRRFGHIALDSEPSGSPDGEQPDLAFDPVRLRLPGMESYDWARALRAPSYATAQAQRPADTDN